MTETHVFKTSGATFMGPDSARWPAWRFQSVAAIEEARIGEHNARIAVEAQAVDRRK